MLVSAFEAEADPAFRPGWVDRRPSAFAAVPLRSGPAACGQVRPFSFAHRVAALDREQPFDRFRAAPLGCDDDVVEVPAVGVRREAAE